jgi:hypothetical protein
MAMKIGTGANYAALVGFSFPSGYAPTQFRIKTTKLKIQKPVPKSDVQFVLDAGTSSIDVQIAGKFYSLSDYNSLAQQVSVSAVDSSGSAIDYMQRFYINGTDYIYIYTGSISQDQLATDPLAYSYNGSFMGVTPFIYTDDPGGATTQIYTGTGASASWNTVKNAGTAYAFPILQVTAATNPITVITLTYGSLVMTWTGSCAAGKTVKLVCDFSEDAQSTWCGGGGAFIDAINVGGLSGIFVLAAGVSGKTLSVAVTGGADGNAITLTIPWRRPA